MILLVDNYDSFTYNIVDLLRTSTSRTIHVLNSSQLSLEAIHPYSHIIFSPGPGLPSDFPIMNDILDAYDEYKSILGICLGHQAICSHYGATLYHLDTVFHGVQSRIQCVPDSHLFVSKKTMTVGRYHSWAIKDIPASLKITAYDDQGIVMAVEHRSKRVYGVQFHPESYMTVNGYKIFQHFLNEL